jgi:hypothetical protein
MQTKLYQDLASAMASRSANVFPIMPSDSKQHLRLWCIVGEARDIE